MANVMDWGIEMGIFPGIINYCLYVYTRVHFHVSWDNIIMIQNVCIQKLDIQSIVILLPSIKLMMQGKSHSVETEFNYNFV